MEDDPVVAALIEQVNQELEASGSETRIVSNRDVLFVTGAGVLGSLGLPSLTNTLIETVSFHEEMVCLVYPPDTKGPRVVYGQDKTSRLKYNNSHYNTQGRIARPRERRQRKSR